MFGPSRRAVRSNASWGCSRTVRPSLAAVHRAHSGQLRPAAPKTAWRAGVRVRVVPAGQVTVPAASSTVKSSMVNAPATAGRSGPGLLTAVCPASARAARGVVGAVGAVTRDLEGGPGSGSLTSRSRPTTASWVSSGGAGAGVAGVGGRSRRRVRRGSDGTEGRWRMPSRCPPCAAGGGCRNVLDGTTWRLWVVPGVVPPLWKRWSNRDKSIGHETCSAVEPLSRSCPDCGHNL